WVGICFAAIAPGCRSQLLTQALYSIKLNISLIQALLRFQQPTVSPPTTRKMTTYKTRPTLNPAVPLPPPAEPTKVHPPPNHPLPRQTTTSTFTRTTTTLLAFFSVRIFSDSTPPHPLNQ